MRPSEHASSFNIGSCTGGVLVPRVQAIYSEVEPGDDAQNAANCSRDYSWKVSASSLRAIRGQLPDIEHPTGITEGGDPSKLQHEGLVMDKWDRKRGAPPEGETNALHSYCFPAPFER